MDPPGPGRRRPGTGRAESCESGAGQTPGLLTPDPSAQRQERQYMPYRPYRQDQQQEHYQHQQRPHQHQQHQQRQHHHEHRQYHSPDQAHRGYQEHQRLQQHHQHQQHQEPQESNQQHRQHYQQPRQHQYHQEPYQREQHDRQHQQQFQQQQGHYERQQHNEHHQYHQQQYQQHRQKYHQHQQYDQHQEYHQRTPENHQRQQYNQQVQHDQQYLEHIEKPERQEHQEPQEPEEPPPPYQLRYARSATNLRAAHDRPTTAVVDRRGEMPVDFVVDELPTPSELSRASTNEIRRVKSSSALSASVAPEVKPKDTPPKWKAALGEAQYFAGGLVSRPAESTRHYSIIRHSHALVWYRGPATTVSITILSDTELPATRKVWLQQKGYSGNVGMSLKALMGTTGNWLDVTPATKAGPENIPEMDERGIQRDLKRFVKKASGKQKKHIARETHVVRIPAAATDGYFRLVLCAGEDSKKVLCGCPVFRVASTSTDVSVVRGASLSTMPLEVGVKVGSTVAQQVAKRYAGVAAAVVQNRATKAATNQAVKKVTTVGKKVTATGKTVVKTTGMDAAVMQSWEKGKDERYDPIVLETALSVIGSDEGPEPPFPVALEGTVARASGMSTSELGIPTANLRGVRDEIKMRWKGVFAAWVSIVPVKGMEDISCDWHEALVTVGPLRYAPPEVVMKNRVTVHFIHDFDGATFFDMKVRVVLMGHLHPPLDREADLDDLVRQHDEDTMTVLASLGRDRWSIDDAIKQDRTMSERLDGVTGAVQGRVDRIPLHWAGVRSESFAKRDKVYGNGGLWIPR